MHTNIYSSITAGPDARKKNSSYSTTPDQEIIKIQGSTGLLRQPLRPAHTTTTFIQVSYINYLTHLKVC